MKAFDLGLHCLLTSLLLDAFTVPFSGTNGLTQTFVHVLHERLLKGSLANSADPFQTLFSVASDQGLQCLQSIQEFL